MSPWDSSPVRDDNGMSNAGNYYSLSMQICLYNFIQIEMFLFISHNSVIFHTDLIATPDTLWSHINLYLAWGNKTFKLYKSQEC